MLFHIVPSVLLSMATLLTAISKILMGCLRLLTIRRMVEKATMESKTKGTMGKKNKKLNQ